MQIEVVVPRIPSFLEPMPVKKSAAERRRERRAQERRIVLWPDRIGGYSPKDWRDLQRRQDHRCAHCRRERKLFASRKVPPNRGGTNFIGNIVGLCWTCKNWKHGKLYCELRYLTAKLDRYEFKTAGTNLQARRHRRFQALAVERGFMRAPGIPYLATDPDACVCKKGQAPHRRGSLVCKEAS